MSEINNIRGAGRILMNVSSLILRNKTYMLLTTNTPEMLDAIRHQQQYFSDRALLEILHELKQKGFVYLMTPFLAQHVVPGTRIFLSELTEPARTTIAIQHSQYQRPKSFMEVLIMAQGEDMYSGIYLTECREQVDAVKHSWARGATSRVLSTSTAAEFIIALPINDLPARTINSLDECAENTADFIRRCLIEAETR